MHISEEKVHGFIKPIKGFPFPKNFFKNYCPMGKKKKLKVYTMAPWQTQQEGSSYGHCKTTVNLILGHYSQYLGCT